MPESSPDSAAPAADELLSDSNTANSSAADTQQTDAKPDSSPAPAGTMLDAVQAALEPKAASPAPKEPGQADEADPNAKPADAEAEESDELSPEEAKALSWKAQQRFKTLAGKVKAKDGEIADLKPKAEGYDKMLGAIERAGISPEELDELVQVGGWMRQAPEKARERLLQVLDARDNVLGERLSPELQEQVRLGYLTEQHARELSRSRAGARLSTQRAEELAAQQKAEREAAERKTLVDSSIQAAERWDQQQAEKDPDWHLKRKEVADLVELELTREARKSGKPYFPTAEETVKLSNAALKAVNERLSRFKPRPTEIRPTTSSASTRSKPAPKSTLDAINNALG
jgi:hypothetical protein